MSYKEAIQELDVLLTCVEFAVDNLGVVQAALSENAVDAKKSGSALFCTYEYLKDLHDQMTTLVNRAIKEGSEPDPVLEACA